MELKKTSGLKMMSDNGKKKLVNRAVKMPNTYFRNLQINTSFAAQAILQINFFNNISASQPSISKGKRGCRS